MDVEGDTERLCPDAPVPVLDVGTERARPGGAGLAALLAARDGADVVLITAIGDTGRATACAACCPGEIDLVRLPLKGATRARPGYAPGARPCSGIDTGDGRAGYAPGSAAARAIRRAGCVLVSDYGRGVARVAREALRDAEAPIVWDPHPRGEEPLPGCALLTPSEPEARRLCSSPYRGPDQAARRLLSDLRAEAVTVTLGARGAVLAVRDGPVTKVPAPVVAAGQDACGAGDRLASATALALGGGASVEEAISAGVGEASRFVARGGAAAVRVREQELGDRPRALEVAERPARTAGG